MKVARWGNSLAVRLPSELVTTLALKEGDDVELSPAGDGAFGVRRKLTHDQAITELRKFRGTMPKGFKFNRDEANER